MDIRGGSVVKGPQMTVGWSEPVIFGNFGCHIFGAVRVELQLLKPVLLSSVMKCLIGFPVTLKCLTLNDLDVPFYTKICFYRRFD